ncbi:hypothetical protein BH11GEM2_BH11GEM2_07160 [soil metagenome]
MTASVMPAGEAADISRFDHEHYFGLSAALSLGLVSAFAPMLAFYGGVLFLLLCSTRLNRRTVRWISLICAFGISVSMASRKTFGEADDFTNYYKVYLDVLATGSKALGVFGNEVGLPLFYRILAVPGIRNPVLPLFAVAMLSSVLLVIWLDRHGSRLFPPERYGSVVAVTLLFCGFLMSTQVTRQFLSSCFLLFAISNPRGRGLMWLLVATLFHQTALPLFVLIKVAVRYRWRFLIATAIFTLVILVYFQAIVRLGLSVNLNAFAVGAKLLYYAGYYADTGTQSASAALTELRVVTMICVAAALCSKYMPRGWAPLILGVGVLYIIFLPFPMMSFRLFLLFGVVITGYLISFLSYRVGWAPLTSVAVALALWRFSGSFSGRDQSVFALWDKYDFAGFFPFYYVLAIFR